MFKVIAIVVIAVVALVFTFTKIDPNVNNSKNEEVISLVDENQIRIVIDGQIVHPGSYSMSPSQTIGDLVEKAGGFLESADQDAIMIDTALENRTNVYIPPKSTYSTECEVEAGVEKININSASAAQLSTLDGISLTLGEKIVAYRLENGPFLALEDVKNVSGIGDATYQKIRDYIRLK